MHFDDNFIEVMPGWLIDPALKITINTSGHQESGRNDAMLHLTYDPEIAEGRLTVPPSAEQRARRLAIPSRAHLADQPLVFQSANRTSFADLAIVWSEPDDTLRLKIDRDLEGFFLKEKLIASSSIPAVSASPRDFLLYAVRSAVKLRTIRDWTVCERYPDVRRVQVFVRNNVAERFFGLSISEYEGEPGWACLASREVVQ